jgi:hypothetical protein
MARPNPWKDVEFGNRERDQRPEGGWGTLVLLLVLAGGLTAAAGAVLGYAVFGEVHYPLDSDKIEFQAKTLSELKETILWAYMVAGALAGAGSAVWAVLKFWRGK